MPRVSVVIPNYNYARFLPQRLRSVLDQTFDDLEVIYLDDGSTDDSREVVSRYLDDGRIRTFHYWPNSGNPFVQWNRGLKKCRGEYVWIAEADDFADPRLLQTLVGRLDRHPEAGIAYCESWQVGEDGEVIGSNAEYTRGLNRRRWQQDYVCNGVEECREALIFLNTIPNASAVVFRRSLCEQVGGADESCRICGDWRMWVDIALQSGVAFTAEPLNYFRSHRQTVRSTTQDDGSYVEERARMVNYLLPKIDLGDRRLALLKRSFLGSWMATSRGRGVPWRRQWSIYRSVRQFDPSIGRRVFGHGLRYALRPARELVQLPFRKVQPKCDSPEEKGIMPNRVLFISHDASRTGAPIVLLHLLRWLRANTDLEFDVLLGNGGELATAFEEVAKVFYFNSDGPRGLLRKVLGRMGLGRMGLGRMGLGRMGLSRLDIDRERDVAAGRRRVLEELCGREIGLVYSNTVVNGGVMQALSVLDCPMLCHVHELHHWIAFETDQGVFNFTKENAQHYVAASQAVKENLAANHGIPRTCIDVVHEFVQTDLMSVHDKADAKAAVCRRFGLPRDAVLVGACGTTDWRKGADLMVQVARAVRQRTAELPVQFLWIGGASEGPLWGKLVHDVQRCGLSDCVHFLGTHEDPSELFAALDVYTLTSREDPYPLAMLEAAAAGNPIVCFEESGGAPEFVEDDAGLIVPYLDTHGMADAVVRLIVDEGLRRRMGQRASEKVCQRHDVRVGAPAVYNVILRFLGLPARQVPRRKAA